MQTAQFHVRSPEERIRGFDSGSEGWAITGVERFSEPTEESGVIDGWRFTDASGAFIDIPDEYLPITADYYRNGYPIEAVDSMALAIASLDDADQRSFAEWYISRMYDDIENTPATEIGWTVMYSLQKSLRLIQEVDNEYLLEKFSRDILDPNLHPFAKEVANFCIRSDALVTPEMPVEIVESSDRTSYSLSYWGRTVFVTNGIEGGTPPYSASELLRGKALSIIDSTGVVCGILDTQLAIKDKDGVVQGVFYTNMQSFAEEAYYGEPVDESIDMLNVTLPDSREEYLLSDWWNYSTTALPLFTRYRMFELHEKHQESLRKMREISSIANLERLDVLAQILDTDTLCRTIDVLHTYLNPSYDALADFTMSGDGQAEEFEMYTERRDFIATYLSNIYNLTEVPDLVVGEFVVGKEAYDALEEKAIYQFNELIDFIDVQCRSLTDVENIFFLRASEVPLQAVKIIGGLSQDVEDLELPEIPPTALFDVVDFLRENPSAKNASKDLFEFIVATYYLKQRDSFFDPEQNPLVNKGWFYDMYNLGNAMSESAPTTNSQLDIDRTVNAFVHLREKVIAREGQFRKIRVLWGGIGKGDRLESKVVERLLKLGFELEMYAIDQNDYSSEWPENLQGVQFTHGNFADISTIYAGQQFDIVLFPWSATTDVIKHMVLRKVMSDSQSILSPVGNVVIDVPTSIGKHSYRESVRDPVNLEMGVAGLAVRNFKGADERDIPTVLNVAEMELLLALYVLDLGYVPDNLSGSFEDWVRLIDRINRDDSSLSEDADIMNSFFYQANGNNRAAMILSSVGVKEALRLYGFSGSSFLALLDKFRTKHS